MNLDNFLENNFPNFYYQEVVWNKLYKACKRCGLMYSKKELRDGICDKCKALPIINTTKEKIIFVIASIFTLIVVLSILIVIR